MSECRYCGELIRWMKDSINASTGMRWIPVDPDTVDDEEAEWFDPKAGHCSHFDTCTAQTERNISEAEYQARLEEGESSK